MYLTASLEELLGLHAQPHGTDPGQPNPWGGQFLALPALGGQVVGLWGINGYNAYAHVRLKYARFLRPVRKLAHEYVQ